MRDLYQKWQIEMANNFEDGERRGYIVKKEDVRRNNERIETYLELGFGFKDFAKKVGYSEGSLRNKWNRTELEKAHNPCVIKNNILKPLSKSSSSRMGHKVSVGKKSRITDILLDRFIEHTAVKNGKINSESKSSPLGIIKKIFNS
ncbi:hypothetical protein [Ligilactobacillus salivarius]|uniref:hypothetical protein n=1 Tax=Ligilactobacillus salivarius TaxID=1624 RepID=UPI00147541EF|nr:hypothetical protein [Ligilactobacillus salivarius]